MSSASPADHTIDPPADPIELRRRLIALTPSSLLRVSLLMVSGLDADPVVYDVPISAELAGELAGQIAQTASGAADAELRVANPGFRPSAQQWIYSAVPPASVLSTIDAAVTGTAHQQYDRSVEFGRKSVLVLRVRGEDGVDLGRLYQAFSTEKALQRSKVWALWSGQQFVRLTDEPLVIDRSLRLIVVGGTVVMQSAAAFERLFGALPELRAKAAQTFRSAIGPLDIVDGDKLAAACQSDINMMRKLVSIQAKLDRPGYADVVTMPALVKFLGDHPKIGVVVQDRDGPKPKLVYTADAQHRWAILKLLDDDFLRSDLTDITYEANSKVQL